MNDCYKFYWIAVIACLPLVSFASGSSRRLEDGTTTLYPLYEVVPNRTDVERKELCEAVNQHENEWFERFFHNQNIQNYNSANTVKELSVPFAIVSKNKDFNAQGGPETNRCFKMERTGPMSAKAVKTPCYSAPQEWRQTQLGDHCHPVLCWDDVFSSDSPSSSPSNAPTNEPSSFPTYAPRQKYKDYHDDPYQNDPYQNDPYKRRTTEVWRDRRGPRGAPKKNQRVPTGNNARRAQGTTVHLCVANKWLVDHPLKYQWLVPMDSSGEWLDVWYTYYDLGLSDCEEENNFLNLHECMVEGARNTFAAPPDFVFELFQPAVCECGKTPRVTTRRRSSSLFQCVDIDECQEVNSCPENSYCTNTLGDYKCTCNSGYANIETGAPEVEKGGTCIEAVQFDVLQIEATSFQMRASIADENATEAVLSLFQIADGAAGMAVPVRRHMNAKTQFTGGWMDETLDFGGLNPGSRFSLRVEIPGKEGQTIYESAFVTTKCYCSKLSNQMDNITAMDESGRPDNALAVQKNGFVMFQFQDNSRCEEAYSFARLDPEADRYPVEKQVFTSDYYYFSVQECGAEPYSPGLQAADDLRFSKLTVGKLYEYQIRASASQPWRNSVATKVYHTVHWQASIDGQVTLEPEAGGLPVGDVIVQYRMEALDGSVVPICISASDEGWCDTVSSASGKFHIDISLVHPSLNNNDDFPVKMRFGKTSGNITHRFLCENTDCTGAMTVAEEVLHEIEFVEGGNETMIDGETGNNSTTVYLRHLEFNTPLRVIDDTTVPFRGRVSVANTFLPFEEELGCPVRRAEVCLMDHASRNKFQVQEPVCVETDDQGFYELPAVIGTTVSPQVSYNNHTFEAISATNRQLFRRGITIKADGAYDRMDLEDVTMTTLTIEVAGGLCNYPLGVSNIKVTMRGCAWEGITLSQSQYRRDYKVIAQFLDVSVQGVSGRQDISDALGLQERSIDLRELEEDQGTGSSLQEDINNSRGNQTSDLDPGSPEAQAIDESEQEEVDRTNPKLVRFQYNGNDKLRVSFGMSVDTGNCTTSDGSSYHVIESLTLFQVTIFAWQDFGYDIPQCGKYPQNTNVILNSNIGLASENPGDDIFIKNLEKMPQFEHIAKMIRECSGISSCLVPLESSEGTAPAKASKLLASGQPNPTPPDHTKSLYVTMTKSGVKHRAQAVVEGDFELPGGFTVAVPSHKPILVLRDPPGGGSYSFYENVITTTRVEMERYETFYGFDISTGVEFGGGMSLGMCAGIGVQGCQRLIEVENSAYGGIDGGANFMVSLIDREKTASFTTKWSYRTSDDEWVAGRQSDIFLVPSLNAKFRQVDEISFRPDACAVKERKLKFNIKSPENKPAISFLSRFDIETIEMPELERLWNATEKNLTSLECPRTIEEANQDTPAECNETIVNRDMFRDGYDDWVDFLKRHDLISQQASEGDLSRVGEWFDQVKEASKDDSINSPDSHYSAIIPQKLADSAEKAKFLTEGHSEKLGEGNSSTAETELEFVNLIKFEGGGSEMRFELKQDMMKAHNKMIGRPTENMKTHGGIGGGFKVEIESAITFDFVHRGHHGVDHEGHHEQSDGSRDETVIGFVLNDADSGDVFDVEVFLDPDYGTFVFHTVGGRSRCPVEDGTVPREQPHIEFLPVPSTLPLPDDKIHFIVKLSNHGISPSAFQLFTEHRTNTGIVSHLANGDTLAVPQQYDRIDANETVTTVVSLGRGPLVYDSPPFTLFFRSACENVRNIGDGNLIANPNPASALVSLYNFVDTNRALGEQQRIRFARACPGIEWDRELALEKTFRVNLVEGSPDVLNVTVRNPKAPHISFSELVASTELEEAGLWYRRVGTTSWYRALLEDEKRIDFTKEEESAYGSIRANWYVGTLDDGDYEIEARTLCKKDPLVPTEFHSSVTPRLEGYLDRRGPKLFGPSSPVFGGPLFPNDVMYFHFGEPIQCSQPFGFKVEVVIYPQSTNTDGGRRLGSNGTDDSASGNVFSHDSTIVHKNRDVDIVCEGRKISVALDASKVNFDVILGSNLTITLTEVKDLRGNPQAPDEDISNSFYLALPTHVPGGDSSATAAAAGEEERRLDLIEAEEPQDTSKEMQDMMVLVRETIQESARARETIEESQRNANFLFLSIFVIVLLLLVLLLVLLAGGYLLFSHMQHQPNPKALLGNGV